MRSAHPPRMQTPPQADPLLPPVNRMTGVSENITLPQTLWMVTRKDSSRRRTTCLPIVSPSVATRCQHQLGVHQMNKFEQFSSLGHQMSAQLNKFVLCRFSERHGCSNVIPAAQLRCHDFPSFCVLYFSFYCDCYSQMCTLPHIRICFNHLFNLWCRPLIHHLCHKFTSFD